MAVETPEPAARPAHRPSAREAMLDAAEEHLGGGGALSLETAARAAGVSKPGLMYHFATKEQLLTAVLERIATRYEEGMAQALSTAAPRAAGMADLREATAAQRHLAYLDWAAAAPLTAADLVIFADPKLRVALTERWQEQIDRWLHVPAGTPPARRGRLLSVRLMADGLWFDRAAGLLATTSAHAATLRALAVAMLEEEA